MSLIPIKELFHFEKGSLQSSKCIPGDFDFITAAADWKTHNEYSHECEALIFAAAASGSLGRTHYVNGKFISSDLCFILIPKDPKKYPIDLKFYHLIFQAFKDEIVRNTKSGTSKEAIGLTVFGKYKLPYFDFYKQQEVKEQFVSAQETTIGLDTELTHQLDLVKQLRQAFLREAMQGKLMPQDPNDEPALVLLEKIKAEKERLVKEKKIKKQKPLPQITEEEIPFDIPKNWVWCRLGEIIDFFNGKAHEQSVSEFGEFILVTSKFVSTNGEKYRRVKARLTPLSTNDIAFVMSDVPNGIALARTYYVENDKSYTLNQRIGGLRPINGIYPRWLCYVVDRNQYFIDIDDGKKQTNLRKDQILYCPICLPPLSEQHRIVANLDELMAYCDELEASIKVSQQQNELLLQQVLREALEPKNVEQV